MSRRRFPAAVLGIVFAVALPAAPPTPTQVSLARHTYYHAGTIVFSFRPLLTDERYSRFWPMWGADGAIYYVADPLPDDRNVRPGSPAVRKSVKNLFKIPAAGGSPVQVTRHSSGHLYWPSMSSDGTTIVYEEGFGLWRLDVASGRSSEITLQIA